MFMKISGYYKKWNKIKDENEEKRAKIIQDACKGISEEFTKAVALAAKECDEEEYAAELAYRHATGKSVGE